MNPITPKEIRRNNRQMIYQQIYNRKFISQRALCEELRLSRPTVTACLSSLLEEGLIRETGPVESPLAGRKATGYAIVEDFRLFAGAEVSSSSLRAVVMNLYGEVQCEASFPISYVNNPTVHRRMTDYLLDFWDQNHVVRSRLTGLGMAFPAIISSDGRSLRYSPLLANTGLTAQAFEEGLHLPCSFLSVASCEALCELSSNPQVEDALYLSLSRQVAGALISGRVLTFGKHGHTMDIAHLPLRQDGRKCSCGSTGCLETFCSTTALLHGSETLDDFFDALRGGSTAHASRWVIYLIDLARAIHHLHLICDTEIILGGDLGAHLTEEDLTLLYDQLDHLMLYHEDRDFLRISRTLPGRTAVGAALPFVWSFLGALG